MQASDYDRTSTCLFALLDLVRIGQTLLGVCES